MNDWIGGGSSHYGGYQQQQVHNRDYWKGRESTSVGISKKEPPKPQIEIKVKSVTIPGAKPSAPPPTVVNSDIMGFGTMTETYTWREDKCETIVDWNGPKIPMSAWTQALAFLRWANDTHKCEAQLRIFSNMRTKETKIWAFSQSIRQGLSTVEYNVLADEDRKMFPEEEGWRYIGTIHSHCNAGAGQSGIDHHDELPVDGWHITVGHLDRDQLDLHCRLAVGNRFFTMSTWVHELFELPEGVRQHFAGMGKLSDRLLEEMVKYRPGKDHPFPESWKTGMKEEPRTYSSTVTTSTSTGEKKKEEFNATIHLTYTEEELKKIFPEDYLYPIALMVRNRGISIARINRAWSTLGGVNYKDLGDMYEACQQYRTFPSVLTQKVAITDPLTRVIIKVIACAPVLDLMNYAYERNFHPVSMLRAFDDIEERIDQIETELELAASQAASGPLID